VSGDDPDVDELRRRQREQETTEREQVADAETDAEAETHLRRADKARYLRRKLEQRQRTEHDAGDDGEPDLPPAA
jgi:hypothetical protein